MKPRLLVALFLAAALAGCENELPFVTDDDAAEPAIEIPEAPERPPVVDPVTPPPVTLPADPVAELTEHKFFPMVPGTLWVYEGEDDGEFLREEIRVLHETLVIEGVECTVFSQEVFLEGELTELATEYFALDGDGNVWKYGEEAYVIEDGVLVLEEDSWMAGVDGTEPWMLFPAEPVVGETYAGNHGAGEDSFQVLSLDTQIVVPAGAFNNCMKVLENPDDPEDSDIVIYTPGVGMVSEQGPDVRIDLVSVTTEG